MGRSPVTTAVAVFLLALGIGANTAIFSFVDVLILRMLPVENPKSWFSSDLRPPQETAAASRMET